MPRTTLDEMFLCASLGEEKYDALKRKEKEMEVRSPWHHDPRGGLSEQKVAKLFAERGGKCWHCGKKLRPGDKWTVGHMVALERGGSDDWENKAPECAACKPIRDAEDHGQAASNRSKATKHFLPKELRTKSRLQSRGFPKRRED